MLGSVSHILQAFLQIQAKIMLSDLLQMAFNLMGDVRALEYYLEGKKDSRELVVFMQGWPDNHEVWEPLEWKENLKDKRLLFIDFPNTTKSGQNLKWGQDFTVIAQRIKATLDQVDLSYFEKKIIVAHDWGCYYTYVFDKMFPRTVDQLIMLDVPPEGEYLTMKISLYIFIYMMILTFAFLVGGRIGKAITQGLCKFMKYQPKYIKDISGANNYPYYYLFKDQLLNVFTPSKKVLANYRPSVPVVFLYGKLKPAVFHGDKWLNYLKESEGCESQGLLVGHWIMNKYGTFIANLIIRRLKSY